MRMLYCQILPWKKPLAALITCVQRGQKGGRGVSGVGVDLLVSAQRTK